MLPSFAFILLPLLAPTYHALPTTPSTEIPKCGPSSVFYNPSNKCQLLLEGEVCKEGEWLVVNRSTKEPECRNRTCGRFELPLYSHPDLCVPVGSPGEHCGLNQILVADQFGFGHCECEYNRGYIYWPQDNNCYRVFHRGPCDSGNIFLLNIRNRTAICRSNPCPDDQIFWRSIGKCVSENDPTLCPSGEILTIGRLPDRQFTLVCEPPTRILLIGSHTFRTCEPGSIRMKEGACEDNLFGSVPSGERRRPFWWMSRLLELNFLE